jgi:hypothetical protein
MADDTTDPKRAALHQTAQRAADSAKAAADNIRAYLEMHGATQNTLVFKVADETLTNTQKAVDHSVEAAVKSLQDYLELLRGRK